MLRIGASLSMAILTGLGASIGVTLPMILKGSGLFAGAPSLLSLPGLIVLGGVTAMLVGVVFCARAGLLRESATGAASPQKGSYATNILIIVVCGILSAGISFTFIYSQDEIVRAVTSHGAGPDRGQCLRMGDCPAKWHAGEYRLSCDPDYPRRIMVPVCRSPCIRECFQKLGPYIRSCHAKATISEERRCKRALPLPPSETTRERLDTP